jgi:predicted flavoprotein YhiN
MYRLKVSIIGARMGDLMAGITMAQTGYAVKIYDRVSES